jgi:acylglycerol lipase
MKNDPYMTVANLTARMGQQSIQAFQKIEEDPCFDQHESFFSELPILFLMGSDDKVTSLEHAKQFHARIPNKDKEFKEFDGLYHCLFHEPEKEQVIGHITEWLNRRFPLLTVKN